MPLLNSYVIRFHASEMNGTESFHITAESLEKAKRMWEDYIEENPSVGYYYKNRERFQHLSKFVLLAVLLANSIEKERLIIRSLFYVSFIPFFIPYYIPNLHIT